MRHKKFIIVKDWNDKNVELRIGYPFFHKDLLTKDDNKLNKDCYGGGYWELDIENKIIKLFGKSDDFGIPKKKDIQEGIKNLDKDKWGQIGWICERIYEEEYLNEDYDNMKDNYKFDIEYYKE